MRQDIKGRNKFFVFSILLGVLLCFNVKAQTDRGNKYFESLQYAKAAEIYEKVLKKGEDSVAVKHLAECYRRLNEIKKAEQYYKRASELYPNDPEIQLTYGQLLKMNNKADKAKEVFVVYASNNPDDQYGKRYVLSCDKIRSWQIEIPDYQVSDSLALNTEFSEFSAVPFENGIVFVTDRFQDHIEDTKSGQDAPYLKIAYSEFEKDSTLSRAKTMSGPFNNHYHSGPVAFNANNTLAVLTQVDVARKQGSDFVNKPQLYFVQKENGKWLKPVPYEHNNLNSSFVHGMLSKDGSTLFFSSDKPGGVGGFDLYLSKKTSNGWSEPENLGKVINTPGNEIFPFSYSKDTLYFSSNTHPGYGGQDIFYAVNKGGNWGTPVNLKNAVNSTRDDFGIYFTGRKKGMFSSSRSGNDDIYNFELVSELKKQTSVTGVFLYSELDPAKNALIKLLDEDGNLLMETTTDEEGKFEFNDLMSDDNYVFLIDEEDPKLNTDSKIYLTNDQGEKVVTLNQLTSGEFKFRMLDPEEIAELPTLKEEDVELSFQDIYGQIYDFLPGDFSDKLTVNIVDEDGDIVYTTTTDSLGNFEFKNVLNLSSYSIKISPDTSISMLFKDDEGNKLAEAERTEDGSYDYKKQEFLASSSVFGRVYQTLPGDFGRQMEVQLLDDEGNIVYSTMTDENGDFVFENLPTDQNYTFKLKEEDAQFKLLMLDEEGQPKELAKQDNEGNYVLEQSPEEPQTGLFGKVYETLPGDYSKSLEVYLVDDNGEIVYTTTLDENGNFVFENLPPDVNYTVRLADSSDELNMIVLDEEGKVKSKAEINESGEFEVAEKTSENALFGKVYQELPGDFGKRMEVYLVDDNGEIVYTTTTDENGDFIFENLPPDHGYKLRLQEVDAGVNMMVLNEVGQMQQAQADNTGNFVVEEVETTDLLGNVYESLPGDINKLVTLGLVDDEGKIVFKTKSDKNGYFAFRNIPADNSYTLKLLDVNEDSKIIILNEQGEMLANTSNTGNGTYLYEVTEPIEEEAGNDLFGRAFKTLPGDFNEKMEVYLVDDNGEIVYTTTTDENGDFVFENLPPDHNYKIKFKDNPGDATILILDEFGNKVAKTTVNESGAYEPVEADNSLFGRAFKELPGDFNERMEVYLVDDNGDIVYTTTTDENGDFVFENLPPDHNYKIRFKENMSDANIVILDEFGDEVTQSPPNEKGEYGTQPEDNSLFGRAYKTLPGDFGKKMEVYLVDDNGDIVYTTTTDENGEFVFENLPVDHNYILKFNTNDPEMKVVMLDEGGNEKGEATVDESGDFNYNYLAPKEEFISLLTLNDAVIKIKVEDQLIKFAVYFEYDSDQLTKSSIEELQKVILLMKKNPHIGLKISGFTDNKGSDKYNLRLSEKRAQAVVKHLVNNDISASRLSAKGYGETNFVAPNTYPDGSDNPVGRQKNRRTEITITRNKK